MVLCKFFQQGSCRFGSKCVNEHLDIKQMVKTDVESAVNGKQWPLSTYGPFRDKPSIPNFIEDQSFEEVRLLCYEAKQKNFFDQFHQQFNREALEASNKMKALLQMTPDILDIITNVYDTPVEAINSGVNLGKSTVNVGNPFGLASSSNSVGGSVFQKSTNATQGSNIFSNQGSTGMFANLSSFASQQPQQQTSIFAQPPKPTNSIFVGGSTANSQQNTSIFPQQQNQQNIFHSQQNPSSTNGMFAQQNQFMQQGQQNSNLFRQPVQVSQPPQGLFAHASQTMQQQQQQQAQPQQGLFAQASQQPAGQGLFAQAAQQAQNIYAQTLQQQQANPNMFPQNIANTGIQPQQANANIFQQSKQNSAQQQTQHQQPPSGFFHQAALQLQNPTGPPNQSVQVSTTLYSRLEDLTVDEIEAFKADCFLPGKIPFNPPPKELVN